MFLGYNVYIPETNRLSSSTGSHQKLRPPSTGGVLMELLTVKIEKPTEVNVIFGQAHFIKTVEDIHEALVGAVPGIEFGLAFCEASGPALGRTSGTSKEMIALATVSYTHLRA